MFEHIEWLWKTEGSGDGDCPSLMKVDGGYIAVGKSLDAGTTAQVAAIGSDNNSGIGGDETAVFIPADVIDRIRELG